MQVSREASPLNPGAKFNEPLDSWFCCFQIWGRSFWPVNHQLSALPSKIKKKKRKKKWQLLGLKHPCVPAAAAWCSIPEGKWEKPCTAEQQLGTQGRFIYIWNYPPKSVSVVLLHTNAPAAVIGSQKTLICSKLIHKMLNNSFSLPWLTKSTNCASPKIPGHLRKSDPEKMILNQISWGNSAALWVQLSKNFCISKPH